MIKSALFTDFYELTMAQGYWKHNKNTKAVFDMFFRRQPFSGGFSVFAGLDPLLEILENLSFSKEDIEYLSSLKIFDPTFLDWLKEFKFTGNLYAMDEGTIVFPNEPLIRVEASVIEAAVIESLLLNTINFQSLIATKTARIWLASGKGSIMEFGLRRAQGNDGAMSASRAAFIGGAAVTSNTLAGKQYGIPVAGTMAHSWIMSYPNEIDAFEAYAELYPNQSVFLIDTYNTLDSGLPAAIKVGKKLIEKGYNFGVRLDSGDLHYLTKEVRKELDKNGLTSAKITVSNELSEEIVEFLTYNKAPIDSWGIGTNMVTGGTDSSFTGVYKLASRTNSKGILIPTMKLSDNPEKMTNPGTKQVWRLFNNDGTIKADILALEHEVLQSGIKNTYYHPLNDWQSFSFTASSVKPLLQKKMENGKRIEQNGDINEIKQRVQEGLEQLDCSHKRILNPHLYKVSLTEQLKQLKTGFIKNLHENH